MVALNLMAVTLRSLLYDLYISEVEKSLGKKISITHVKVPFPKGYEKMLPMDITGQPSCYVVRDLDCIKINKFEVSNNE